MTQFVFINFAFLENMYIVHSLNEMLQSVTKMLRHLKQKVHLQMSPDSQEEIWYKKKKTNKSCTLPRFDVVHQYMILLLSRDALRWITWWTIFCCHGNMSQQLIWWWLWCLKKYFNETFLISVFIPLQNH